MSLEKQQQKKRGSQTLLYQFNEVRVQTKKEKRVL